ncbi:MAG: hypothetical protein IAI48_04605 [Candidatus Eremiobacteraeota bacterium]|nr:hypothetical protein [Candidatus Eremiobacteraeota bacterium]
MIVRLTTFFVVVSLSTALAASTRPNGGLKAIEYGARGDGHGQVLAAGLNSWNTPDAVAVTSDGAVWFRETLTWHPRIARFAPDGSFREYVVPDPAGLSYGDSRAFVAAGNAVLFGPLVRSAAGWQIRRISERGEVDWAAAPGCIVGGVTFACFPGHRGDPTHTVGLDDVTSVTRGPRGDIWFTSERASLIGRVTAGGVRTVFTRGLTRWDSGPQFITTGPDGNMWFTEKRDRIGRITQDGRITEFSNGIPRRASLGAIVAGRDGNLWFTLYHGMVMGRITIGGRVRLYHDLVYPSSGHEDDPLSMLVTDAAGRLYYNEGQAGRIARLTIPADSQ